MSRLTKSQACDIVGISPAMEAVRCGGDLRNLGGSGPQEITFLCPDGAVLFRLTAEQRPE